jgi:DICT domain-containing protein
MQRIWAQVLESQREILARAVDSLHHVRVGVGVWVLRIQEFYCREVQILRHRLPDRLRALLANQALIQAATGTWTLTFSTTGRAG